MGSKAGRFMEGMHIVGDILTKISANCVINLLVYFYGFILCMVMTVCIFMGISCKCCMHMFTVISV
jgi:hypothetical protein